MRTRSSFVVILLSLLAATFCPALEWQTLPIPAGRSLGTFVADDSGRQALLFGGGSSGEFRNDAWLLSLDSVNGYRWQQCQFAGAPPARSGHAAILDPHHRRVLVFGGMNGSGARNDLWQFDVAARTWTQVPPSGAWPAARVWFTGVHHPARNSMIVFGGSSGPGGVGKNDVWELDLDSLKWTELHPSGTPPSGRSSYNAGLSLTRNRLIIHSGQSGSSIVDDIWALDLTAGAESWTQLSPTGDGPGARSNCACALDPTGDRFICFGGWDYPGYVHKYNDLHVLDLNALQWAELHPTGTIPAERRCATPLWDGATGNFIFFSGETDGGWAGDLYYINLANLACEEVPPPSIPTRTDIELPTVARAPFRARCLAPNGTALSLRIIDASGRLIAEPLPSSGGSFTWDGTDASGTAAPAGTYFCTLEAGTETVSRSFRLVR